MEINVILFLFYLHKLIPLAHLTGEEYRLPCRNVALDFINAVDLKESAY